MVQKQRENRRDKMQRKLEIRTHRKKGLVKDRDTTGYPTFRGNLPLIFLKTAGEQSGGLTTIYPPTLYTYTP